MLNIRHLLLTICLVSPAFAQDQCDEDSLTGYQLCVESCQEEAPNCDLEVSNPIDDVVASIEDRCVFDSSGEVLPKQRCTVCINTAIKDLSKGPRKGLLAPIVRELKQKIGDLRQDCGKTFDDGGDGEDGGDGFDTPGDNLEGGGGGAGK